MTAINSQIIPEYTISRFTTYLLAGDRQGCRTVTEELLAADIPIISIYQNLFQTALYHVGDLWETNRISVAREHIATAIVESLLALTFPLICNPIKTGKSVVVACTPGELHQLGARMVADILEMHGWDTHFLGASTPEESILQYLLETKPSLICLSLSTHMNLANLISLIARIRESLPLTPIAAGGQAFRWGGVEQLSKFPGVRHVTSLGGLEEIIKHVC